MIKLIAATSTGVTANSHEIVTTPNALQITKIIPSAATVAITDIIMFNFILGSYAIKIRCVNR